MEVKRVSLELSEGLLNTIDQFKREWGLRSRGAIVERLLQELLTTEETEDLFDEFHSEQRKLNLDDTNEAGSVNTPGRESNGKDAGALKEDGHRSTVDRPSAKSQTSSPSSHPGVSLSPANQQTRINGLDASDFNERGALVLVAKGAAGSLVLAFESSGSDTGAPVPEPSSKSGGIDLPGFVRKQSAQIKRSLAPTNENSSRQQEPLPTVPVELLNQALERAKNHWLELYGTPANDAVLEAAMVWLAKDIWPQCDQSEGRLFTWSLACSVIEAFAPTWPPGGASFEKVMVMAGLLEDPFSTSTLQLRLPTLIRRFVHR